jgi:drug/metabolite transporter (DMT)-like permease
VFGILWGNLFLAENITTAMIVGSSLVVLGTALVTGFNPVAVFSRKESTKTAA